VKEETIAEIIFEAIEEVNDQREEDDGPDAELLPLDDLSIVLTGDGAQVDSLELISILTTIEECLEGEGYDIDLTDDAATAAVPWETGETLLAYIVDRLA
jgi:hypothetical protein